MEVKVTGIEGYFIASASMKLKPSDAKETEHEALTSLLENAVMHRLAVCNLILQLESMIGETENKKECKNEQNC